MVIIPDLVNKIRTNIENSWNQLGPRQTTSYFLEMTNAIGTGIVQSIADMGFVTKDTGLTGAPVVSAGVGVGLGVFPDVGTLTREIYVRIRQKSQAHAETLDTNTGHPVWDRPFEIPVGYDQPYSPPDNNALFGMAKGIALAVFDCFSTQIILNSSHPFAYMGEGVVEYYTNIDASEISGKIYSNSSTLLGPMWPQICDAIGEALNYTLQNDTEAEVVITGVCVPHITQTCGIPVTNVQGVGQVA